MHIKGKLLWNVFPQEFAIILIIHRRVTPALRHKPNTSLQTCGGVFAKLPMILISSDLACS